MTKEPSTTEERNALWNTLEGYSSARHLYEIHNELLGMLLKERFLTFRDGTHYHLIEMPYAKTFCGLSATLFPTWFTFFTSVPTQKLLCNSCRLAMLAVHNRIYHLVNFFNAFSLWVYDQQPNQLGTYMFAITEI